MKRTRRNRSRAEIREIVGEFEKSGLTQTAFATRAGIHVSVLGRWIRDLRGRLRGKRDPKVIPVRVTAPKPSSPGTDSLEVVLRNGRLIRLRAGFDETTLRRLVETLERC